MASSDVKPEVHSEEVIDVVTCEELTDVPVSCEVTS